MLLAERERPASTSALEEPGLRLRRGMRLHAWPASRALAPGEALEWPLWLHPRAPGAFDFHLALHYEPETPVEGMRYR